jgi:fermentation-respiration switch protein FrsA (DUF1100 family)
MMGRTSESTYSLEGSIIVGVSGIPAFYDPPDPFPTGKPGALIRAELELMAAGIAMVRRPIPGVAFLISAMYSRNVPGHARVVASIFVGQGDADQVVPPAMTELFVRRLQLKGDNVRRHRYHGVDHNGLLAACPPDVIAWLGERVQAATQQRSSNT